MTRLGFCIGLAALAFATPAFAAENGAIETAAAALAPNRFIWSDTATDPVASQVTIVVSLPLQQAFVYRGDALVAATTISSGRDGKDTPVGTYTILQKETMHRSNLYNSAPMPFMQRLTWDGIAIHAGRNPGFPDSHGCIRVPAEFAKKLFAITDVGTRVIVTDEATNEPVAEPAYAPEDQGDGGASVSETARANAEQLASAR